MREIKFRAWDSKDKSMATDEHIQTIEQHGEHWDIYMGQGIRNEYSRTNYRLCNPILMQYTGLKDKNGREIYEGDILECVSMHDSNIDYWGIRPPRYEIKWDNHETGYCLANPYRSLPMDISDNWIVAGNIYENPLLLEVK